LGRKVEGVWRTESPSGIPVHSPGRGLETESTT